MSLDFLGFPNHTSSEGHPERETLGYVNYTLPPKRHLCWRVRGSGCLLLLPRGPSHGLILEMCSVRNTSLCCLAHSYFCSINWLYGVHSKKPTLTSLSPPKKCQLGHPLPHSRRTPSFSAFPPSIPTLLHITALITLYNNCLVTCLSPS